MTNKEETQQTGPTKEERVKIAKINLEDDYLRGLVAAKVGTPEEYGGLIKGIYESTVSNTPRDNAYQQLILPELTNPEGALTSERMKAKAMQILGGSLANVTVSDALKYSGVEEDPIEFYARGFVDELSEEEQQLVFSAYMQSLVEDVIAHKVLPGRRKMRTKTLEDKFCSAPKEQ